MSDRRVIIVMGFAVFLGIVLLAAGVGAPPAVVVLLGFPAMFAAWYFLARRRR